MVNPNNNDNQWVVWNTVKNSNTTSTASSSSSSNPHPSRPQNDPYGPLTSSNMPHMLPNCEKQRQEELLQKMGNHPSNLTYQLSQIQNAGQNGSQHVRTTPPTHLPENLNVNVNNTTSSYFTTGGTPWQPHHQGNVSSAGGASHQDYTLIKEQIANWPNLISKDQMAFPSFQNLLRKTQQLRQQNKERPSFSQQFGVAPSLIAHPPTTAANSAPNSNNSHNNMPSSSSSRNMESFNRESVTGNNNVSGSNDTNTMPTPRVPLQTWSDSRVAYSAAHLGSVRNGNVNKTPTSTVYGGDDDVATPKASQALSSSSSASVKPQSNFPQDMMAKNMDSNTTSNIVSGVPSLSDSVSTTSTSSATHSRTPSADMEPPRLTLQSLLAGSIDNVDIRDASDVSCQEGAYSSDSDNNNTTNNHHQGEPYGAVSEHAD
ncbi:hypothetical protein Sste5346_000842 [Sporothrix stenoceras]|uniref:Uncharacterized protein n=1 Tax=Sporothrix stenoceras TaxID=5173 RepID=A0ABR3ZR87_9PEZI